VQLGALASEVKGEGEYEEEDGELEGLAAASPGLSCDGDTARFCRLESGDVSLGGERGAAGDTPEEDDGGDLQNEELEGEKDVDRWKPGEAGLGPSGFLKGMVNWRRGGRPRRKGVGVAAAERLLRGGTAFSILGRLRPEGADLGGRTAGGDVAVSMRSPEGVVAVFTRPGGGV
jgi:hypothetical protein